jgi:hypothetical protein
VAAQFQFSCFAHPAAEVCLTVVAIVLCCAAAFVFHFSAAPVRMPPALALLVWCVARLWISLPCAASTRPSGCSQQVREYGVVVMP